MTGYTSGAAGSRVGSSVAIAGDFVAGGAWSDDTAATDAGAVYWASYDSGAARWSNAASQLTASPDLYLLVLSSEPMGDAFYALNWRLPNTMK